MVRNFGDSGGRRAGVAAALAVVATILAIGRPTALNAQEMYGSRQGDEIAGSPIELTVYFGAMLPMSALGSQGDSIQADLSTKPSFAASLDFWFGGGFGVGVMGGYTNPRLSLQEVDPILNTQMATGLGNVDYLHGEALLLWRPVMRASSTVLLPHFGAGVGIKNMSFDPDANVGVAFEDVSDITIVLNAGAQIRISDRIHSRLDVRDLISSFDGGPFVDSNVQHDLFVQVGLGIGF